MKFLVYETTNLVNGKVYRGAHVCDHDSCCYLGSGSLFKKALAKYGSENFKRKVLRECDSIEEMFEAERELVNEEWVKDPNTYNLKIGGEGGWDYINKNKVRWNDEKRKSWSEEMKERHASGTYQNSPFKNGIWTGRKHTEETKRKLSENNASKLDPDDIAQRMADIVECQYPLRGSIKKLSERWGVSHTQVKRFINAHMPV